MFIFLKNQEIEDPGLTKVWGETIYKISVSINSKELKYQVMYKIIAN